MESAFGCNHKVQEYFKYGNRYSYLTPNSIEIYFEWQASTSQIIYGATMAIVALIKVLLVLSLAAFYLPFVCVYSIFEKKGLVDTSQITSTNWIILLTTPKSKNHHTLHMAF
jgi:hypothetical protein